MNKNFLKVLGISALVGVLINSVYEIGIKEGDRQCTQLLLEEISKMRENFNI